MSGSALLKSAIRKPEIKKKVKKQVTFLKPVKVEYTFEKQSRQPSPEPEGYTSRPGSPTDE